MTKISLNSITSKEQEKPEKRVALGRRALFAGVATLTAAPAASAAIADANTDAALVAQCYRFAARDIEFGIAAPWTAWT